MDADKESRGLVKTALNITDAISMIKMNILEWPGEEAAVAVEFYGCEKEGKYLNSGCKCKIYTRKVSHHLHLKS